MYWATGTLGFLFAISPYLFGYSDNFAALWTSLLLGGAVIVVSFVEGVARGKQQWEYVAAVLAGLAAVVSPFMFGFGNHQVATWTTIGIGVVVAFLAGIRLYGGTSLDDID